MSLPARVAPVLRLVPKTGAREPEPEEQRRSLLDDSEILAAVRRGDPNAATALYHRVRPAVVKTTLRLLGRKDADHEDLVQTSIIEIVKSLNGFRGECALDTWSSRITAHTVFREIRKRARTRRLVQPEAPDHEPQEAPSGVQQTEARSSLRRIWVHLQAMDELKAWTLVLHDVAGFDLREIAQITNASVAAAQSRLVRGRAELHERIAADSELADELRGRRAR
jgi:RNA polymerase sigma-70 factor (ECF subfamily)